MVFKRYDAMRWVDCDESCEVFDVHVPWLEVQILHILKYIKNADTMTISLNKEIC